MKVYILLFLMISFTIADESINVSVNSYQIVEGESVNLTLTIRDIKGDPEIDFSTMTDFKIISGPEKSSSTSVQYINGKMSKSSTVEISWNLIPNRLGKVPIPALKIKIGKNVYLSDPILISVAKRGSSNKGKNPQFFLEAKVDKDTIYRGDQLTLTYTLFTKVDVTSFDEEMPSFKGFWIEELFSPKKLQLKPEIKNGVKYHSAIIKKIALFPTQSGSLIIQPLYAQIGIREKQQRWNDFSLFGPPSKKYTISTNKINLNVIPVPINIDNSGSVLVGQWDIRSNINTSIIKQDEAIVLQIVIAGTGNLQIVPIPKINFPNELEVFDPEVKTKKNPLRDQIGGEKIFEWVLIPRYAGEILIPQIVLDYFDPIKKKWIRKSTSRYNLKVADNKKAVYTAVGLSKEEVTLLGEDIHFLDDSIPTWLNKNRALIDSRSIALALLSSLILAFPFLLNFRNNQFNNSIADRRAKKALKSSIAILNSDVTSPDQMGLKIYKAIVSFINDKIDSRKAEYSNSEILAILKNKIDDVRLQNLEKILLRLESARFGGFISYSFESDINKIEILLRKIDHDWK